MKIFAYICTRISEKQILIMINRQLINPASIVVIGGSNNTLKPGGALVRNLIQGNYQGELYVVNPHEDIVQGVKSYRDVKDIPEAELAIIAVVSKFCPSYVEYLASEKGVKAFIVISSGFSELSLDGAVLEAKMHAVCNKYGCSFIGPNCIGLITSNFCGAFTSPNPVICSEGVDLISNSGGIALYTIEMAKVTGLRFNSVWSIGNARYTGVEDVLQYMDETFDAEKDVRGKILYIESIRDPERLLRHAKSLIAKGCRIAAIKSGSTQSGTRATSHHTGSAAFDDKRADELFREAGIVRCYSRQELVAMGCLFSLPRIEGNRFAIITQAGGLGVLTADALSKGGMLVPELKGEVTDELLTHLHEGASVSNPIDVLATGTVEQLETVIDYCDKRFDEIDAIILSYGSAGLEPMDGCFDAIHRKLGECRKPVITICPSIFTEAEGLKNFLAKGHVNLLDEELAVRCVVRVAGAVSGSSGQECFG